MSESADADRHSRAFEPGLVADPDERAAREARNGLRQFDRVIELVEYFLDPDRPFKLRSSHLLTLLARLWTESATTQGISGQPVLQSVEANISLSAHIKCRKPSRRYATTSMKTGMRRAPFIWRHTVCGG